MRVHIIYFNFLDDSHSKLSVGGIQNYISSLISALKKIKIDCSVYQLSSESFISEYAGATVYGIESSGKSKKKKKDLYEKARMNFSKGDFLIYGCDSMIYRKSEIPSLAIQHGVFWDKPEHTEFGIIKNYLYGMVKYIRGIKIVKHASMVDKMVCVDYNFVNWYRTMLAYPIVDLKVVPNFSVIAPVNEKAKDRINIIFARRFFPYRGTRIFGEAILKILSEYENVYVTIAGSGPDQKYIDDTFGQMEHVKITRYSDGESLKIHADKHIAVIPTTGSEGTSLSLLEAMSSQCAIVCTDVGGMTNIVIDHYNGLMVSPNAEELFFAIKCLIEDENLRNTLAMRAYETVNIGFSYDKWEKKWLDIIKDFISNNGDK